MNPRQIFHTFIITSEIILFCSILSLSIFGSINTPMGKERVWICSKILTMNQILKNNMDNIFPLLSITSELVNNTLHISYSDLLKTSSKNNCKIGYKGCGILDSAKNILCIEESSPCPINEIELTNEADKMFTYHNYFLKYSNNAINKKLIINITISDEYPKYITKENFIFDNDTYEEEKAKSLVGESKGGGYGGSGGGGSGGGGFGGGGLGGGGGGMRVLDDDDYYGDKKMTSYILDKFNENNNIDKEYYMINYILGIILVLIFMIK